MKAKITMEGEIDLSIRFRAKKRSVDIQLDFAPTDQDVELEAALLWAVLKKAMPWRVRASFEHIVASEEKAKYAGMPEA